MIGMHKLGLTAQMFVCYRIIKEGVGISLSVSSRGWTALLVLVHPHSILCYNLGGGKKTTGRFSIAGFLPYLGAGRHGGRAAIHLLHW